MKPMKKLIFLVLTLCLAAALCPALAVPALAADTDGFVIEGTTLKQYTGPGGSVTIPDGVTEISASAFKGNTTVTSVTIPDSVTKIMSEGFKGCTSLTKVVLPKRLASVPYMCFTGCTALTEVNFPEGLTALGENSFQGCTSLRKVVLPDGITSLNSYCFEGCTSLTDVTLPEKITALPSSCFEGCTSLTGVVLPEGIVTLESSCFKRCTSLTKIVLPDSVTSLGIGYNFEGCTSLTEVVLSKGLTKIPSVCFFGCSSLKNIDIPDTVTTIENQVFQDSAIEKLSIPASVTRIGNLAGSSSSNRIKEITFEGKDLSGLSASIYPSVTVYVQPGTVIPDCLSGNIVLTAGETPQYRLSVPDGGDGKLDLGSFTITSGSVSAKSTVSKNVLKNTGTETWGNLQFQTSKPELCSISGAVFDLSPNGTVYFSFTPKADLTSGSYTAPVTVTADGGHQFNFEISFTVEAYTCISVEPKTLDFGSAVVGYAQPAAKTITITNTGDHPVDLTHNTLNNFTCSVSKTRLDKGQSATVTIQPKAGLAIKSSPYTEKISFTCGQHSGVSFTADLKFTVKGQPKLASSPTEMDFGKAKLGYTPQEMTVTITNTGAGSTVLKTATLSSPNFEFSLRLYEGGYERGPGQSADLKVRPVSGLKEGTYTGTLDIDTSDEGVKLSIPLKFVVEGENSISVSPDILNFGSVEENYTQPAAKTVTIKNTGKSSVTLQTPTSTNYVLGSFSRTTLAAGAEATFTIRPKAGLKKGVYTEWIIIKTAQNDSASIGIDFQVQEKKKGSSFVDVKEGDWFYEDVEYVYEKGLMNGVGNDRFNPGGITSRGQIVTILYRLDGEPAVSGRSSFPDVGSGQYYTNAVKWASDHQIVSGYSNGNFGPDDPITREQMAAILYRYASYKKYNVSAQTNLSKFKDAKSISDYALNALAWANSRGLITGVNDGSTIKPQGNASRAEAAAILHRFSENIV